MEKRAEHFAVAYLQLIRLINYQCAPHVSRSAEEVQTDYVEVLEDTSDNLVLFHKDAYKAHTGLILCTVAPKKKTLKKMRQSPAKFMDLGSRSEILSLELR